MSGVSEPVSALPKDPGTENEVPESRGDEMFIDTESKLPTQPIYGRPNIALLKGAHDLVIDRGSINIPPLRGSRLECLSHEVQGRTVIRPVNATLIESQYPL